MSVAFQSRTCASRGKVWKGKVYSHSARWKGVGPAPSLLSSPPSPGPLCLPATTRVSQQLGNRHTAPHWVTGRDGVVGCRLKAGEGSPAQEREPLLSTCLGRHRSRGLNLNLLICPLSYISKQVCTFHRWGNGDVKAESHCQNLIPGLPDSKAQVS